MDFALYNGQHITSNGLFYYNYLGNLLKVPISVSGYMARFYYYSVLYKFSVYNANSDLFRHRVPRRLIWVCTVLPMTILAVSKLTKVNNIPS